MKFKILVLVIVTFTAFLELFVLQNNFDFYNLVWRFKPRKQAKLQWNQQDIAESRSLAQSSINVILDQNSKYIESKNKLDAPIASVEIVYFSLKQLIQNFGANINKNHEYTCPSVAFCSTSVLRERSSGRGKKMKFMRRKRVHNKVMALVNMVGHCGRSKSHLSQLYFDAVDDLQERYHRIFLCGEGYDRNRETWNELDRYDVAMLFDARPPISPLSTDLLYFNPHVRSGISHIKRTHGRAFSGRKYQKYLIAIFISNCDRKLLRNEYIMKILDMHKVDEPENHIKSFGACFAVQGDRTNLKTFLQHEKDGSFSGKWQDDKINAIRYFKFTVAMENTINRPFYVTEKVFDAFKGGSIPIYYGPDEIYLFVPNFSIINAKHYKGEELVHYLDYLNRNKSAYDEYFDWRKPGSAKFAEYMNRPWIKSGLLEDAWQCRLCVWLAANRLN